MRDFSENSKPAQIVHPLADASEICRMNARQLADAFHQRMISPVEAIRESLDRAETINSRFNAFVSIDHDEALAEARRSEKRWCQGAPFSMFDGIPVTIKDIVSVRGRPMRAGSNATSAVPQVADCPVVERLRVSGSIIIGLTTTPEFGHQAVTQSPLTGLTKNPWNSDLTPGGSSGGAAVAAATGAGVFHLGTDGGGSIRIPAAFTSIVGHKPTYGLVPAYPPSPYGTLAHLGPMARSVVDAALMLGVIAGRDPRDWYQAPAVFPGCELIQFSFSGASVGYWTTPASGALDVEVASICDRAVRRIEEAGAEVETVELPGFPLHEMFSVMWNSSSAARFHAIPEERRGLCDPSFIEIAEEGSRISASDLCAVATARAEFGRQIDELFGKYDVIISPATAIAAFAAGTQVPPGSGGNQWTDWAGFNFPINLSQQPACDVPCGFTKDNRPVGLQFVGVRGQDSKVLSVAAEFERHFSSANSIPQNNRRR